MNSRIRLSPSERKKEILNAGMRVFKKKGFEHTSMEDVIAETSLSKGGVYHYYKNTTDILHDLMLAGLEYRMSIIREKMNLIHPKDMMKFIADELVKKIVDDNSYMDIYVQFLIAKNRNEKLETLFQDLKAINRDNFMSKIEGMPSEYINDDAYDLLTNIINSLIIGSELLGGRKNFKENSEALKKAIITIFEKK